MLPLNIYISGQVHTLNKTFKLSYASKVFCRGWQTIPNFYNTVSKKYFLTSTRLWRTNNLLRCPRVVSFQLMRKNFGQSKSTKPKIISYV